MGEPTQFFIGLMSGTSLDGIDAALVSFENQQCNFIGAIEHNIPESLRQELLALCQPGYNEIDRMGTADRELGNHFAAACNKLLEISHTQPGQINAIGSHGQTIRHRPNNNPAFTLQIGDPNTIAQLTGITTVADFRRRDIAAGGQGAPLAPVFHQAIFSSTEHNRAVINIGGMANVTFLGSDGSIAGFDTGPGNVLMDSWIKKCCDKKYDAEGLWAASGTPIAALTDILLSHEYFSKQSPKSTGREEFDLAWLESCIGKNHYKSEDVQASLLELTAQTIAREVENLPAAVAGTYICGGGAYNTHLMHRLAALTKTNPFGDTSLLGIPPEWVEAVGFAWLAKQALNGQQTRLSAITGANADVISGAIYQA